MDCPKVYEKQIIVNSREVDGSGVLRASAILAHLQDASAEHSALCGCSRVEMMAEHNVVWMLTRIRVTLFRPIRWLESLTIRTWHRGGRNVFLYRDYDLLVGDEPVGEAVALWVLSDLETKKMLNLSVTTVPGIVDSAGGLPPKPIRLKAIHPEPNAALWDRRLLRYSETDVNAHINNTRYADFCCDAIPMARFQGNSWLQGFEITYHAECKAGETLLLYSTETESTYQVDGRLEDGAEKFSGRLTFAG